MFRLRSVRYSQKIYRTFLRNSRSFRCASVTACHSLQRNFQGVDLATNRVPAYKIDCRYKSNGEPTQHSVYVQYEDLVQLIEAGEVRLIDVRDAKEIDEKGEFPGAYNIPLQDLKKALKLKEEDFKDMYKFDKPKTGDTDVVFASLKAVKSSAALEIAHKLGFTKTRQYVNGYEEWEEKQKAGQSEAAG